MTIASSPPFSISRVQASTFWRADASACFLAAHVMDERPAAAFALRHHDLDAEPGEQRDRRVVDAGVEHGLRAAGEQRDALLARARGGMHAGRGVPRARRHRIRRELQHGRKRLQRRHAIRTAWRTAAPSRASFSAARNRAGLGSTKASSARIMPVGERPLVGLLDMRARMVDQMHVVHAGRAGGHAGEAGQAAVDMGDDLACPPAGRSPACP